MYLLQRPRFTLIKLIAITRLLSPSSPPVPFLSSVGSILRKLFALFNVGRHCRSDATFLLWTLSRLLVNSARFRRTVTGWLPPLHVEIARQLKIVSLRTLSKWGRGVKGTINNTRLVTCVTALVFPVRFVSREIFRKKENFFFFLDGWKAFFKVAYLNFFFFSVQFQFSSIKFVLH